MIRTLFLLAAASAALQAQTAADALGAYIEDSLTIQESVRPAPGSLFAENGYLAEVARDPRAGRVGDLITVLVSEQASALTSGATSQARDSDSSSGVSALLGIMAATRPLPNLFGQNSSSSLNGQASTSRQTNVSAVITAYVTQVMPNGNLIVEGAKEVSVNSERQLVWIRGVVRQIDLAQDNSISSARIGLLDLRVNGRGVVQDAIRRPNAIYRIFRKLLPF
ncbi:MAG: flagellar basal body L-ring protein FlgH [Acidobacteria bacterium]|nr:flagellar basal body L-ring protein FlgH [Acidobacteriota bacterium]